jgi:hypothetical protein
VWYVGDVVSAKEPPMPRHFKRVYANEAIDPITVLRRSLDEHDIDWDEDWDVDRLSAALDNAEKDEKDRFALTKQLDDLGIKYDKDMTIPQLRYLRKNVDFEKVQSGKKGK